MKTVLFLASRFPYPITNGRDKTLVEYLSFFKNQKVNLIFGYFGKNAVDSKLLNQLQEHIGITFQKVIFLPLSKLSNVLGRVALESLLLQQKSMQEALFYSKKIQIELNNVAEQYKPDVVFCDMLRTAQYFSNANRTDSDPLKIFDMDDILSNRYKYLLKQKESNILGNFSDNMPKFINTMANRILKGFILNLEAKLVKKREILLAKAFDKVILVSPVEAENLNKEIKKAAIYFLYPSASPRKGSSFPEKEPFSISFMGLLNVPHNKHALLHFLDEMFPVLIKKLPKLKLYIIGGGASSKLLQYGEMYPENIVFTGYVDDYTNYLLKTKVFIAPINFGTGIKLKVLDAMSLGLPIVTTKIGAEGLKVANNTDIFIKDDSISFVNTIIDLLNSDKLAGDIGRNAVNYVRNYHDYNKLKERFLEILELNEGI